MHLWLINQTPRPHKLPTVWHPRPHAHADTLPEAGKRRQLLSWFAGCLRGMGKPQVCPINNSQVGWSGVINMASHCWLSEPRKSRCNGSSWTTVSGRTAEKAEVTVGNIRPYQHPWDSNLLPPYQEFTPTCVFIVKDKTGPGLFWMKEEGTLTLTSGMEIGLQVDPPVFLNSGIENLLNWFLTITISIAYVFMMAYVFLFFFSRVNRPQVSEFWECNIVTLTGKGRCNLAQLAGRFCKSPFLCIQEVGVDTQPSVLADDQRPERHWQQDREKQGGDTQMSSQLQNCWA